MREVRVTLRMPEDAARFIEALAEVNFTSKNAEIVRSVRERMVAAAGEGVQTSPAAAE